MPWRRASLSTTSTGSAEARLHRFRADDCSGCIKTGSTWCAPLEDGRPGPGVEGRRNFFASCFEQAPCCAGGEWAKPGHACAIFAPRAAAAALHGRGGRSRTVSPALGGDARGSTRAGLSFLRRALNKRLDVRRVTGHGPGTPAPFPRRTLQRLHYTVGEQCRPRRAGDARGSTRAGVTFSRRAVSERPVARGVTGPSPGTPALFSGRMLQRAYYTVEDGVARVGAGRSRLHIRPTRAGTSLERRAFEARLLDRRKHELGRGTPVPLLGPELQRSHFTGMLWARPRTTARPARASRAGLTFFRCALRERLVTRKVPGHSSATPALFLRRLLERSHYTAEQGVARVGRRRA